jgi:cobalt-zinc-cadmium efflux system membrane fusion protein
MSRTIRTLFAVAALAACRKEAGVPPGPGETGNAARAAPAAASPDRHGPEAEAEATDAHGGEHGGHGGGADKKSDLDQPVETLLAQSCEHRKKTFECEECRYSVGVARVPRAMLEDGLVKTAVAARRKLEAPLALTGEIRFDERRVTHLAPSTEARVRAVRVTLGQRVRAGEALVELESVGLGEAQSQYLEARGALELASRAAERV